MPTPELSLQNWIAFVFDHPVHGDQPAWYWSLDAPDWQDTPEHITELIAETFERSGELLSGFSDAQLEQGFWFLVSGFGSEYMVNLDDPSVPMATRLRALRSFICLFEQIMATRCSPHLSHLDEKPANPLNGSCYMWWDFLPFHGKPEMPERKEFDFEAMRVIKQILAIPHDACRESALHGVGHWRCSYTEVEKIVDDFLATTPDLRPELITYAKNAKVGNVQ